MTTEMLAQDDFDVLLNDVLHTVANPEMPERFTVRTRIWVQQMTASEPMPRTAIPARGAAVFAPEFFLARMAPQGDAKSTTAAILLHAAAIALIFWGVTSHVRFAAPDKTTALAELASPPEMPKSKDTMAGGGGRRGPTPVTKGQLPKFEKMQITPPKVAVDTKVQMPAPSLEVQPDLKMANNTMPNFGMPNSPLVGSSLGNGSGSGLGSGSGSGIGAGTGGGYGGGIRHVGGGVSAPIPIHEVEPEFSEEARRAKFMGTVTVALVVDTQGNPRDVHIARGVGMGLDEKAIDAVRQYKFKPAMLAGKPVPVEVNVEVNFQIF